MKMKKILSTVLVHRSEIENKWWDRLFKVVLYSSGVLVTVLVFYGLFSSSYNVWVTHDPTAFSLEPNYQEATGEELPCSESFDFIGDERFLIKCEGVDISPTDSKRYVALYQAAHTNLQKQYGLDKYSVTDCPTSITGGVGGTCLKQVIDAEQADPAYPAYQSSLNNLARIKVVRDIHFGTILGDIGLWILIPIFVFLAWIIFWDSLVYRVILYIIFGKKISS